MGAHSFEDLLRHVDHKIVCVAYGLPTKPDQRTYLKNIIQQKKTKFLGVKLENQKEVAKGIGTWMPANVAIECETCHEVLLDYDRPVEVT